MTTRTISKKSYIRVDRGESRVATPLLTAALILSGVALILVFFFLTGTYEEAREQFVEKLKKEKQIVELNKALKMELFAITQKGYLEFAAQERLGMKRPKEEEVVVLK